MLFSKEIYLLLCMFSSQYLITAHRITKVFKTPEFLAGKLGNIENETSSLSGKGVVFEQDPYYLSTVAFFENDIFFFDLRNFIPNLPFFSDAKARFLK